MADNVTKMKIVAWSDPQNKKEEGSMMVQVNPESYSQKIEIKYSDKQAQGTSGKLPKFSKIEPQKMDFELMFDRTGVINGATAGEMGVDEDIDNLQKLIIEYQGDKHRPRFVSIYWGTLKFDGALETMDISYKLFNAQGAPLRAVVKASFIGSVEDKKRVAKENAQSPDLTKIRVINEGDTLPLLCYQIYGDSKYYIEVAQANGLNDFRYLKTGSKIKFPPLN
ncbi:MAG TPA: LysM peptidoglycan-binding domain-containing protein [Mucilaginibacter sp.]